MGGWVATNFNVSSRQGFQFYCLLGAFRGLLMTIPCQSLLPDPCLSFTKRKIFTKYVLFMSIYTSGNNLQLDLLESGQFKDKDEIEIILSKWSWNSCTYSELHCGIKYISLSYFVFWRCFKDKIMHENSHKWNNKLEIKRTLLNLQ